MILATPRLHLRPFTRDDVDALHAIWTDPDVRRYLWDDAPYPIYFRIDPDDWMKSTIS